MKKKKDLKVNVDILESIGDGDRYLIRYVVPEKGLTAIEWVSYAGIVQWLNTTKNTSVMNAIMEAVKVKIEETQKEVQNGDKIDSGTKENG